ncbi:MAG TPA: hypothetical protein DEF36_08260 [Desulfotomaculum sp.]|nr:hypothetical protein [Desulfotomaculum sp.]
MDQVIQLQQQVQRLQQEINDISQVCNQLQQSEQSNAIQLQQLTQKELIASQGLRRIQQVAGQLSQDINQISNITQQIATQAPMQRTLQTTGVFPGAYSTYGSATSQIPGTGVFSSQNQLGAFGQTQGAFGQGNFPNINMSPAVTQLPLYTQGYSANLFGSGNQLGTTSQLGMGSQAFSNTAQNQFGLGASSVGMTSPGMYTQSNQGTLSAGYSPYQSNQFGFR